MVIKGYNKMDITLIQGAVTSMKTAFDIAKAMSEMKSMTDVQGKVIELQQAILAAQSSAMTANSEQFAALEELRILRAELDRSKGWELEKKRFSLFQATGGVAYALRESQKNESEPPHYLCANCFDQGRKSIINNHQGVTGFTSWLCPTCKAQFSTGYKGGVPAKFAPD